MRAILTHLEFDAIAVPLVPHVRVTNWQYAAFIVSILALHDLGRPSQGSRKNGFVVYLAVTQNLDII